MRDYARRAMRAGAPLHSVTRHVLGLYHGMPGARAWRRRLSDHVALRASKPAARFLEGVERNGRAAQTDVGVAVRGQADGKQQWVGREVEGVNPIPDPLRPPLAKDRGYQAQARIVARHDATLPDDRDDRRAVRRERGPGRFQRTVALAHHDDPRRAPPCPGLDFRIAAHRPNRLASASATGGRTSALTSPPNRATSRTKLALTYVSPDAGTINTVSRPDQSCRFIRAI